MSIWAKLRQLLSQPPTPPAEQHESHLAKTEDTQDHPSPGRRPTSGPALADTLAREKTLSVISAISHLINLQPARNREQSSAVTAEFLRDFNTPLIEGAVATHSASLDVILHLVHMLAEERGEPAPVTWQREAMELTRRIISEQEQP